MAKASEVFDLVRKYLPRQKLRGKGITLEYLRKVLQEEAGLSYATVWGLRESTGIFNSLRLPIQDLIISYADLKRLTLHDRTVVLPKGVSYYRLSELIGVGDLPLPFPELPYDEIYQRAHCEIFWSRNLSPLFVLYKQFLRYDKKAASYITWAIEKGKRQEENFLKEGIIIALGEDDTPLLSYLLTLATKEDLQDFAYYKKAFDKLDETPIGFFTEPLLSYMIGVRSRNLRLLIAKGLEPKVPLDLNNRDWLLRRITNLLKTTNLPPDIAEFLRETVKNG